MVAAKTVVPVIGVPVRSQALSGVDSLLSIVQMPAGVPVATMAFGPAGAVNAALYAAAIVGNEDEAVRDALRERRAGETSRVLDEPDPRG
jgi:5-(carboxyamino)imidazole ribonucleotide mutase